MNRQFERQVKETRKMEAAMVDYARSAFNQGVDSERISRVIFNRWGYLNEVRGSVLRIAQTGMDGRTNKVGVKLL
jgi:hypothetical protein